MRLEACHAPPTPCGITRNHRKSLGTRWTSHRLYQKEHNGRFRTKNRLVSGTNHLRFCCPLFSCRKPRAPVAQLEARSKNPREVSSGRSSISEYATNVREYSAAFQRAWRRCPRSPVSLPTHLHPRVCLMNIQDTWQKIKQLRRSEIG
jgi:hypothetical protein